MESNLLLEQYSRYKKLELEASPFHFLLDANIEPNPHQINAFCAAIGALKTGGIVLADEVGLGKTIEAGLVLKYVLETGAKRVLIALPASLRKQWELELEDKFGLEADILDRLTVESDASGWRKKLTNTKDVRIVITSYDYSSKLMKRFPDVKWDFIIIDEAHNFRNVFHGTKRAKNLFDMSKGIPKILLTATPLQNSLLDLHGLISFIDPRVFGSEKVFSKRYIKDEDYTDLKRELQPVLYRTLRKDVAKYMNFKKRICKTVDFTLSKDEIELYQRVNDFLKREMLYSIPTSNRALIILVIRKLLASSSFALIETFEVLQKRLEKLKEGSKSASAQEGFDLFWSYVEDEIDESDFEDTENEDTLVQKQFIQAELDEVKRIIEVAKRIKTNAKVDALKTAIGIAFQYQLEAGIPQKVVVFTESKRTQKYVAGELRKSGYAEEDILLFNGDFDDVMTKDIYKACNTAAEIKKEFDKLDRQLNAKRNKKARELRSLLITESGTAKAQALDGTKAELDKYFREVEYWDEVGSPEVDGDLHYWKVDNWGEQVLGSHGTLFVGAFCNNEDLLFPVLLLCDEHGNYIDFDEEDLISALERIDDMDVKYFTPTDEEQTLYQRLYDDLTAEMVQKHREQTEPIMEYNRRKIENWERIQMEQLVVTYQDMNEEIEELKAQERASDNFYEKIDIRKKIDEKSKALEKFQESFHERGSKFKADGEKEIEAFNKQFDINPLLLVNIVLKF